jgi:hypothetical protein
MRAAVEFLDLYCARTKEPNEDEVTLKFNRATLWAGPIRSGITKKIETIKVVQDQTVTVELWQDDSPRRTVNRLGTETLGRTDDDSGTRTAQFTTDAADYTLSYRFLEVSD